MVISMNWLLVQRVHQERGEKTEGNVEYGLFDFYCYAVLVGALVSLL